MADVGLGILLHMYSQVQDNAWMSELTLHLKPLHRQPEVQPGAVDDSSYMYRVGRHYTHRPWQDLHE